MEGHAVHVCVNGSITISSRISVFGLRSSGFRNSFLSNTHNFIYNRLEWHTKVILDL